MHNTPPLPAAPSNSSVGNDAPIAPYAPLLAKTLSLRGAVRRGNPYSLRAASGHYVSVGGGDCPPSCQPIPAHCRGRQSGHFLETDSLLPPPAALRRFPRRPAYAAPPTLSLRTGAHTGVAIRNIHTPHLQPCHCEERSDVAIRPPPTQKPPRQSGGAIPFFTQYVFSQLSVRCRHSSS